MLTLLPTYSKASPSDSEIVEIFNKAYGHSCLTVPLGKRAVGNQTMNSTFLSESRLQTISAWARAGLVTLEIDENRNTTNMFLTGVTKQINVTPTDAGLTASKSSTCGAQDPQTLAIEDFTRKVEKIISSEETKTPVDTFRVVKGTGASVITSAGARLRQEFRMSSENAKIKFIMLLKLDSFSGVWRNSAVDFTGIDTDFKSNNVQKALAAAR